MWRAGQRSASTLGVRRLMCTAPQHASWNLLGPSHSHASCLLPSYYRLLPAYARPQLVLPVCCLPAPWARAQQLAVEVRVEPSPGKGGVQINCLSWLEGVHFDEDVVMRVITTVVRLQAGPAMETAEVLRRLNNLGASFPGTGSSTAVVQMPNKVVSNSGQCPFGTGRSLREQVHWSLLLGTVATSRRNRRSRRSSQNEQKPGWHSPYLPDCPRHGDFWFLQHCIPGQGIDVSRQHAPRFAQNGGLHSLNPGRRSTCFGM